MFKGIRCLAVYCQDLEKSKKFYTEILGFRVASEVAANLCFLKSESGAIYIYLEGGSKPITIDNQTCHLSFFLECEKSISETYNVLKAKGVKLLQEAPEAVNDDTYCFQFQDPDGNIIEVAGRNS